MKLLNFRDVLQSQVWIFNFVLSLTEELGNFTLSSTGLEGTYRRLRLPPLAYEGCEDVALFEELIYRLDAGRICLDFAFLTDQVFSFILIFWRIFLIFGQWSRYFEFQKANDAIANHWVLAILVASIFVVVRSYMVGFYLHMAMSTWAFWIHAF